VSLKESFWVPYTNWELISKKRSLKTEGSASHSSSRNSSVMRTQTSYGVIFSDEIFGWSFKSFACNNHSVLDQLKDFQGINWVPSAQNSKVKKNTGQPGLKLVTTVTD